MKLTIGLILLTLTACSNNDESSKLKSENNALQSKIELLEKELAHNDIVIQSLKNITDSIKNEFNQNQFKSNSLIFLSSGQPTKIEAEKFEDTYAYNYRVSINLSEIYKTLSIKKVEFFGEGNQKVTITKTVDLTEIKGINSEMTNSLKFVKWLSPSSFLIEIYDRSFEVKIQNDLITSIKEK